jgi:hypothetical protein
MRTLANFEKEFIKDRYMGKGNVDITGPEYSRYRLLGVAHHGNPWRDFWSLQSYVAIPFWGQTVKETNKALAKMFNHIDKQVGKESDANDVKQYMKDNDFGWWSYINHDKKWHFWTNYIVLTGDWYD